MKLSTIWYKANRELVQVKDSYGDRNDKTACALGAIYYYDAVDNRSNELAHYMLTDMRQFETLGPAVRKFESETGHSIIRLNDEKRWTFLQFARKARELHL